MNEEKLKNLIHDVYDNVAAYREFIKEKTGSDSLPVNMNVDKVDLASLPLCDKQNYLLRHDVHSLSREGDLSLNYQLTLEDISNQMTINLDVESSLQTDSCKAKEVAEALKQELTDTIRELKVGQEMNFIREFTVKVVALGALPRNTTSGKIKKLIDKRVL